MNEKTFAELVSQTKRLIDKFQKIEQRPWGVEGAMIELSKQVGDLSKLVMVQEKYYLKSRENQPEYAATKQKVADELFDIWFCLVRLAEHYGINFEEAIDNTTQKELKNFEEGKIK
ncbi:MazG-like family protein [Candidatus Saccharibacteria bacterium]|nr:MazG-like family protein [Candidatus Saccharibacteria bacterium]